VAHHPVHRIAPQYARGPLRQLRRAATHGHHSRLLRESHLHSAVVECPHQARYRRWRAPADWQSPQSSGMCAGRMHPVEHRTRHTATTITLVPLTHPCKSHSLLARFGDATVHVSG
jgi:hypothetical protein